MGINESTLAACTSDRIDVFHICAAPVPNKDSKKDSSPRNSVKYVVEEKQCANMHPSDLKKRLMATPSWKQDPSPLPDWSVSEQRIMIEALKGLTPLAKSDLESRRAFLGNLIRPNGPLAGKSLAQCEACFAYVQRKRIAFFGPRKSFS